jgi:uncharacterized membrane protein
VLLALALLLAGWLLGTPPGLLGKADAVGYAVCHRIETRSFHIGDRTIPLCARCTGMYLGAVLGLVYQGFTAGRKRAGMPPKLVLAVLAVLGLAFAADGLNSYLHFFPGAPRVYEPNNTLRLFTGTGMGLVIAAVLYPAFNQSVWRDWSPAPVISGLRSLGALLLLAVGLDLVVLTENPLALYPLALVSAAGVLVLLSMVYAILWLMVFRADSRFQHLRQLFLPLAAGLLTALVQIAAFDFIRYTFTGTWGGFPLPG